MQSVYNTLKADVKRACEALYPDIKPSAMTAIAVEQPRDPSHGDLAVNAAMILAKQLGRKPVEIAGELAEKMRQLPYVSSAEIAGPGFINLRCPAAFWQEQLAIILDEGVGYGGSSLGNGLPTHVEYVSANPTGPLHIGHARGAVVGDALALLLTKAGYDVTREYYINDAGGQIDKLARSVYLRYREACGETIGEIPAGLYPGDYLVGAGEGLRHVHENELLDVPESEWLPIVRPFAIEAMLILIRADLGDLGVHHDVFTSEQELSDRGRITSVIARLREEGHVYEGILEPPKGKPTPEDWEPLEQTLFRSTPHGDDSDRPIIKSDGSFTYFAGDLAYTEDKLARGFKRLIIVLGADHGGYVSRMKALTKVLSHGEAEMELLLCQLVKLYENGEPFKMSKRAGTFVTVRDVLDAVGKDVLRFVMLTRKPEQPLDFDLVKVKEQSKDNPVFYVQYAHARSKSLLRLASREVPQAVAPSAKPDRVILDLLGHDAELALLKRLAYWPQLVESAALAGEPHRVAYYLQEIAAQFHGLWNLGNDDTGLRFVIVDRPELTTARLALARGVAMVIASGLQVLGVEPVEEMR